METSQELQQSFNEIKKQRKNGDLTEREYYKELLKLTKRLLNSLENEDISDKDIKQQIPLMVLFIGDQIDKYKNR